MSTIATNLLKQAHYWVRGKNGGNREKEGGKINNLVVKGY